VPLVLINNGKVAARDIRVYVTTPDSEVNKRFVFPTPPAFPRPVPAWDPHQHLYRLMPKFLDRREGTVEPKPAAGGAAMNFPVRPQTVEMRPNSYVFGLAHSISNRTYLDLGELSLTFRVNKLPEQAFQLRYDIHAEGMPRVEKYILVKLATP